MERLNLEKRLSLIKGDDTCEVALTNGLCNLESTGARLLILDDDVRDSFEALIIGTDGDISNARKIVSETFGNEVAALYDEYVRERNAQTQTRRCSWPSTTRALRLLLQADCLEA